MSSKAGIVLLALALACTGTLPLPALGASKKRPPEDARQDEPSSPAQPQQNFRILDYPALVPYQKALEDSTLFNHLAASGNLEKASVQAGIPPGITFPVQSEDGSKLTATYFPRSEDPKRPEQIQIRTDNEGPYLVNLKEGEKSGQERSSDQFQKGFKKALLGALKEKIAPPNNANILSANSGQKLSEEIRQTASRLSQDPIKDAVKAASVVGYTSRRTPEGIQFLQRVRLPNGEIQEIPYAVKTADGTRHLNSPPGVERYSRSIAGREVLLEYKNGLPRVTHVLHGKDWAAPSPDDLKAISAFTKKLGQALIRTIANSDGSRDTFAYRINEEGVGYRSHQYIDAGKDGRGWVELFEGRPVDKRDMQTAKDEVSARNFVAKMEKYFKEMHEQNLPWSNHAITARTAPTLRRHNPPALSMGEVMQAFGRDKNSVALPGDSQSFGYLVSRSVDQSRKDRPKIALAIVAKDDREAEKHEAALKTFTQLVTQEATKKVGWNEIKALVTQGVNPKDKFMPDHASLVLALTPALEPELRKVNYGNPEKGIPGLNEMYKTAAAQGTRESYQDRPRLTGMAERRLERKPNARLIGKLVDKDTAKKLPRAKKEMAQVRELVLATAAEGVQAEALKATRETAQGLRREGIDSYDVAVVGEKTGEAYRKKLPGGMAFIFSLNEKAGEEGGDYLLNLGQSDLKDKRLASVKAAAYVEFADLSRNDRLSYDEIGRVWTGQISRFYGLNPTEARKKAQELNLF